MFLQEISFQSFLSSCIYKTTSTGLKSKGTNLNIKGATFLVTTYIVTRVLFKMFIDFAKYYLKFVHIHIKFLAHFLNF